MALSGAASIAAVLRGATAAPQFTFAKVDRRVTCYIIRARLSQAA
jgi:hypothetical protein